MQEIFFHELKNISRINGKNVGDHVYQALPINLGSVVANIDVVLGRNLNQVSRQMAIYLRHVSLLLQKNSNILSKPLVPWGDKVNYRGIYNMPEDYTMDALKLYIYEFFVVFLHEYKIFVEMNFPAQKNKFEFYQMLPALVVAELSETEDGKEREVTWTIMKSESNDNEIEVTVRKDVSIFRLDKLNWTVKTSKGVKVIYTERGLLDDFFNPFFRGSKGIIQDWVYRSVREDFRKLYEYPNRSKGLP